MSVNLHVPVTGFMLGYSALHPEGVNANPLPADLSGIPAGMTDHIVFLIGLFYFHRLYAKARHTGRDAGI